MQTIFDFTLPRGYIDSSGNIRRRGKMRLATAGDEISAAKDPRAAGNPAYLSIILLSKVIIEFEGIELVTAGLMENLFTADLMYLQNMYETINEAEAPVMETACPSCGHAYTVPVNFTREG